MRVRPYYLFQCDPVRGTEHFRTTIAQGISLLEQLRGHTSGLAVPTYVIDLPGGGGKVPVGPKFMMDYDERAGRVILRNFQGCVFEYLDPERDPPSVAPTPECSSCGPCDEDTISQIAVLYDDDHGLAFGAGGARSTRVPPVADLDSLDRNPGFPCANKHRRLSGSSV